MGERDPQAIRDWVSGACSKLLRSWLVARGPRQARREGGRPISRNLADKTIGAARRGPNYIIAVDFRKNST